MLRAITLKIWMMSFYNVVFYIFWSWMKSSKFTIFTVHENVQNICSLFRVTRLKKFFFVRLLRTNMLCFVYFVSLSCFQEMFSTNHFWKFDFVFKINITKLSSRVKINVLNKDLTIRRNGLMFNDSQKNKKKNFELRSNEQFRQCFLHHFLQIKKHFMKWFEK